MSRKKKLLLNTSTSIIYQLITVLVGFILPRLYLQYYGSEVNGLVSSITHFLGFITLCNAGVGMVVQSALYKPLADKNEEEISKIFIASEHFFKKIGYILTVYVIVLVAVYPISVKKSFGFIYTGGLILILSISSFAQYYFGLTYRFLLNADQLSFVQLTIDTIALIVNTIFAIFLIKMGSSIHFVRLVSSLVYVIQIMCLRAFVKRHYNINQKIKISGDPIKQKWNGMAQHIASVILGNTDTVVLTLFSTLTNVSIYAVYHLVVNGIKAIVNSLTAGIQAMFGNMLAKKEISHLNETFSLVEWEIHTIVSLVFSMTGILIVPFVSVYTSGITDANYIVPVFGYILTVAQGVYCIRLPYNMIVLAAGHYKETQTSAIIEAIINIVISVATVINFGLIGVAIGTLVAMLYRTLYLVWYIKTNILKRKIMLFVKHVFVDIICVLAIILVGTLLETEVSSYLEWFILAIKVGICGALVSVIINFVFYRKELLKTIKYIRKK